MQNCKIVCWHFEIFTKRLPMRVHFYPIVLEMLGARLFSGSAWE